jgi:hypothetical protein
MRARLSLQSATDLRKPKTTVSFDDENLFLSLIVAPSSVASTPQENPSLRDVARPALPTTRKSPLTKSRCVLRLPIRANISITLFILKGHPLLGRGQDSTTRWQVPKDGTVGSKCFRFAACDVSAFQNCRLLIPIPGKSRR